VYRGVLQRDAARPLLFARLVAHVVIIALLIAIQADEVGSFSKIHPTNAARVLEVLTFGSVTEVITPLLRPAPREPLLGERT
jgi:hypothetical protein